MFTLIKNKKKQRWSLESKTLRQLAESFLTTDHDSLRLGLSDGCDHVCKLGLQGGAPHEKAIDIFHS